MSSDAKDAVNFNGENGEEIAFAPGAAGHSVTEGHDLFPPPQFHRPSAIRRGSGTSENVELMGPILRRKKVVSLPLGAGGDFFYTVEPEEGGKRALLNEYEAHHRRHRERGLSYDPNRVQRQKQLSNEGKASGAQAAPPSPSANRRHARQTTPQNPFMRGIIRRRQVSLDLLGPNDFFGVPDEMQGPFLDDVQEDEDTKDHVGSHEISTAIEEEGDELAVAEAAAGEKPIFFPLRFAPRQILRSAGGGHGGGHGGGGHGGPPQATVTTQESIDPETQNALERYTTAHEQMRAEIMRISKTIPEESSEQLSSILTKMESMGSDHTALKKSVLKHKSTAGTASYSTSTDNDFFQPPGKIAEGAEEIEDEDKDSEEEVKKLVEEEEEEDDPDVIRATKSDKIKAVICFFIMLGLTLLMTLWKTHLDDEIFILSPVGLACVTDCPGNLETRDFFEGHNHFKEDEVIDLILHLDGNVDGEHHGAHAVVEIVGVTTGKVKSTYDFGPPGEERETHTHHIVVDFEDYDEHHIINVNSTDPDVQLSFTLLANVKTPLADSSVIVAAVIMVLVYTFILLEVIHRTLIAIYGSMVALMFFFIMESGHVESIKMIMLHLEWSTLGLLFGMMLIVGELSHTGVFEWCAVRILIQSKGSYVRLLVLLSSLTAVASAFLDNVTTMLLIAPVTIDMCHIVGDIDPRPYLIAEVLLSNIGGTATLIGDPPNIIIGSAFSDIIGFVDFITNILPVIFVFCVPMSLVLVVYIYRWYLTSSKMRVLDTVLLKKTYKIYDEPRLLISGIVTVFVILLFFLHPVHHKDTAWIALMGAFVTISFTNPHDIQSALRSHVEWDTLLFFAGLFVLVEVCAAMGLLQAIGDALASYIASQEEEKQLTVAITLLLWVSAIASSFLDNIPYTATMIPVIKILSEELPNTLPLQTLAWALSLGACLGGNGTLLGASANIVTAGISTNKGYEISFVNFFYPGMLCMILTVAISNLYMLIRYVWI